MKVNKTKSAMTALVVAAMLCSAAMPIRAAEAQWVNNNGTWSYVKEDGSIAKGWIKDNDCWYAFDDNGAMRTGWIASNEHWYFMGESGVMQADAWVEDNGARYYIKGTGVMAKDYVKDGYELTVDGKAIPLAESKSVVLTAPEALEGEVIEGNLYVDVTTAKALELKGVTVKGKLVVIGDNKTAGKLTITDSKIEAISTQTRNTEVVLSGETEVKTIVLEETAAVTPDKNFKGEVEKIEVQSTTKGEIVIEVPAQEVSTRTYASVDIQAPVESLEVKTDTQIKVNADVKNVVVTESAKDTKVEVSKGSTVGTITANAPVKIEGNGTINKVEANVDGVEAGEDTVIKEVEKSEEVEKAPEVNKPSTGGGSSSGGSTVTVPTVNVSSKTEFDSAVAQASTKTKIVLTADIDLGEIDSLDKFMVIPADKNIVLDLNGKIISGALKTNVDTYYTYQILCNNGTLVIEDSLTGGKIINTNADSYICTRTVKNVGTMTINGGEIYSEKGNALINAGTLIINNGAKLTTAAANSGGWNNGASTLDNRALLTINGGVFKSGSHVLFSGDAAAVTTINGGTFTAADAEVLYYTGGKYVVRGGIYNRSLDETYLDAGYYVDSANGMYEVKAVNGAAITVNNNEELINAINSTSVKEAKTITLAKDITLNTNDLLTLAKNSKLVVNTGIKLTINSPIDLNGTLEINGSVDIASNGYIGNLDNILLDTNASLNYDASLSGNSITVAKPMDMQWVAYQYMIGNDMIQTLNITTNLDYLNAHADPIGTDETIFTGTLDGGGHTISNVKIEGSSDMALFGVANDITITNLTISNIEVKGNTARAAVLAAAASGNINVNNVDVSGTVTASSYYAGGLIGSISSNAGETVKFTDCKTSINLTSNYNVGALWGTSEGSQALFTLKNCSNSGIITGGSRGIFAGFSVVGTGSTYENMTYTWPSSDLSVPLFGIMTNFTEISTNDESISFMFSDAETDSDLSNSINADSQESTNTSLSDAEKETGTQSDASLGNVKEG